ncbi:MAG: cytochrome c [Verrucomicrobiales bacterium]|nr:cytochrome c [Verrucomicrobiales bacterium]
MILRHAKAAPAILIAFLVSPAFGEPHQAPASFSGHLTYDNKPLGTEDAPLVLRTYLPNPELDHEVTSRHGTGAETPNYSAKTGLFSTERNDPPITGIPAAFAISAGPGLSYVWDTTECRLLYAWANGFLDMESYWGAPDNGRRKSKDYVPRLIGQLFYKAKGSHPLQINCEALDETLRYTGHRRIAGHPLFSFDSNGRVISVSIRKGTSDQTVEVTYTSSNEGDTLTYLDPGTPFEILETSGGKLRILIRPNAAETYTGFQQEEIEITEVSAEVGEKLYESFGCMACHSIDGGRNHGPTFQGLAGSERDFADLGKVTADSNYLRESIVNPTAKSVPGYPVGMMPAYPLNEKQVDSLVLYIESLSH